LRVGREGRVGESGREGGRNGGREVWGPRGVGVRGRARAAAHTSLTLPFPLCFPLPHRFHLALPSSRHATALKGDKEELEQERDALALQVLCLDYSDIYKHLTLYIDRVICSYRSFIEIHALR